MLELPKGRFNKWCEKEPLVFNGTLQDRALKLQSLLSVSTNPLHRDLLYQREFAGCAGIEFVAFSATLLNEPLTLPGSVILVPCFYTALGGHDVRDPLLQATMHMKRIGRLVYDGWMAWDDWSASGVAKASVSISQALVLPTLAGIAPFEWTAKYRYASSSPPTLEADAHSIADIRALSAALEAMQESDRDAVLRSVAWLAASEHVTDRSAAFLFAVVAVEALSTYVYEDSGTDSAFAALCPDKLTRAERRIAREACIREILDGASNGRLTDAVQTAYFDCVYGIRKRVATHLELVFGANSPEADLFLVGGKDDKSLYDLRNRVAHGGLHRLDQQEHEEVTARVFDAQELARRYILQVLARCTDYSSPARTIRASMSMDPGNMVNSRRGMYSGPTHMGLLYATEPT